ncbi:hypothetical protein [Aneurinibacillus uraniidurans]|uniref:hypothetical protein n=1 Tax=Aneurinibacillus uraniidurans TaxID=2966586 RepID=UPI00234BC248|nr:hypothetical protein [Aneurinibacillus sp. B1]WCN39497.1 hypothetical protein PO771_08920 [Aneurinibacillus sp. B1]
MMNLLIWVAIIFVAHAALYLLLGTTHWLLVTIEATAVWTVVLAVVQYFVRSRRKERA